MKLTVIGAGTIGAGVAYNVALRDVLDEIQIVDLNEEKAKGEALDIAHALAPISDTEVYQAGYDAADDSDVVAVTAGKPRKEGMTRLDLLEANAGIVQAIHENDFGEDSVFVTTTNPMDVINYTHSLVSDYRRERFIGFGGWLDSARFEYVLADYLDRSPSRVHGSVLGEHGDSQVPVFSQVTVEGHGPANIPKKDHDQLRQAARQSAMDVISRKGFTQWAPTRGVADVIEAVAIDAQTVIPCSAILDGEYGHSDVSIGVPAVIGQDGIVDIQDWSLSDAERDAFDESAEKLRGLCEQVPDLL